MTNQSEVERIQQAYKGYAAREANAPIWTSANRGNQQIVSERNQLLQNILQRAQLLPLTDKRILEIGCGSGSVLARFQQLGAIPANLYGVDLLPERIETARRTYPNFNFSQANAEVLEFEASFFDIIVFYTVFSSILDEEMAHHVASEAMRVLQPGGVIIWYDFRYNNPRNTEVRGMTRERITQFFPTYTLQLHSTTLLPPLARKLGLFTSGLYPLLKMLPFLRTHYLGLLFKPALQ